MKSISIRQRDLPAEQDGLPADLHPVIRRVLLSRGVTKTEDLSLDLTQMLSPQNLSGVEEAASLLADAMVAGKTILVVGDFDADGATGTALAVLALRSMGYTQVDFRVPDRFEFGYGLTVKLVETLAEQPPDLLITVDSGISCVEGVKRARELGCQVIITDHHLPGEQLPMADAIVNPNCDGDTFASKATAGVGVVFYLMGVLRQVLRQRDWFTQGRTVPNLAQFLDLVALGTVADLVPLDRNNRVLVNQGIERIRRGLTRPGIMALLRAGNRDYRYVGASELGFTVGPRLNAAGRLEDMSIGIRCLLSDDWDEAESLAIQLDKLNKQRKDIQEQMQEEAMEQIRQWIEKLHSAEELPMAVCLFDDNWHQGIVGLVASKVKDAVQRPVLAFAPESQGSEMLKGSARSVRGLHIRDVLALIDARHPGLMTAFGGHAMAAGLGLPKAQLATFQTALNDAVLTVLDGERISNEVLTDGVLKPDELSLDLAKQIQAHGPWGQRFPEPLFEGQFNVVDHRIVGGSHLKMKLRPHGGNAEIDAIAFNTLPEDLPAGNSPRLLYRLDVNRWRGSETCQLMVEKIVS